MRPLLTSLALLFIVSCASAQYAPYVLTVAGGQPMTNATMADGLQLSQVVAENTVDALSDNNGNLFYQSGGSIKKVGTDGLITTFIAATPPSVPLPPANPFPPIPGIYYSFLAYDNAGSLYTVDNANHLIKKITMSNQTMVTIAGNGTTPSSGANGSSALTAGFDNILDLRYNSGFLYVIELHRIRKIDVALQLIYNVAGTGVAGFSGDGGPATSAQLNNPTSITFDGSNNMYIADVLNQRVRKVTAAGVISTYAGTGTAGFSGDGGAATSATFQYPYSLGFDNTNNSLLIHDLYNARFRKVTSTGTVSTIATRLPYGISYFNTASNGEVYISESGRIRKMSTAGVFSNLTARKTGGDGVVAPGGIVSAGDAVADAAGNIYVADRMTHRVRKIDATTKVVSTILGTGWPGTAVTGGLGTASDISSPSNLLLDASGNIYVSVSSHILKLNLSSNLVTVIAGGGVTVPENVSALTSSIQPRGMALDASGDLLVACGLQYRVRKINLTTGIISTLAGNGSATGGPDNGPPLLASLNEPTDVVVSGTNIFISEGQGQRVRLLNQATGVISTIAGAGNSYADGDATNSRLYNVTGLSLSSTGVLHLMEGITGVSRVRSLTFVTPPYIPPPAPPATPFWYIATHPITTTSPGTYTLQDFSLLPSGAILTTDNSNVLKLVPSSITINITASTFEYNGGNQVPTFTTTPPGATVTFKFGSLTTVKDAGTYVFTATANNGDAIGSTTGVMTINKASLTVTWNNFTRVYGTYVAPTATYAGFKGSDGPADIDSPPAGGAAGNQVAPGTYSINTALGLSDNNYTATYVNGSVTITKALLTITANSYSSVPYGSGGSPGYRGFTVSGRMTWDVNPGDMYTTAPTVTSAATNTSLPGTTWPTIPAGAAGPKYDYAYVNGSLLITKANLTVSAGTTGKYYGQANPTLTPFYSGFVNGETASVLTSTPTISTTATVTSTPGNYPITVTGGSAANYNLSYVAGTLIVYKINLVATPTSTTRPYGSPDPVFAYTYTGFINGDTPATVTTPPTGTTTSTATSVAGTSFTISSSGGVSPNYNFTFGSGTLTIAKAPLTITADNQTRVYGDANPTLTLTYAGFKNGETATALSQPATVSTTAVGTSPVTATYPISVSGAAAANYNITFVAGTLTVTKRPLTATLSLSRVYGSNNPALTVGYTGFANSETAAVLTTLSTATCAATATSPVGTYPIVVTGGSATNYTINNQNGVLTVTPAVITATANNFSRVYATANPMFTVSYSGFVNGQTASVITTQSTASTTALTSSPAGGYPITVTGGVAPNYTFTYVAGTLTVTKAVLTITANNTSRSYGAANPTFTYTPTGFVNGDNATVITTAPTITSSATATSPAGTYSIVPTGANAVSYSFNYVNGTLTVNKVMLTVTATSTSRTYGAANPTFALTYSGFVNSETAASLTPQPTGATTATATSGVGSYTITAGGGGSSNYNFTYVNGTLTINKAALTVTANNQSKTYGDSNPALTISYSGFMNGETAATGLTTTPSISTAVVTTTAAGSYPITVSGGSANNYTLGYTNGTLTINKASLTVTANNQSRPYGSGNPALTYYFSGFVLGESSSVLSVQPSISTSATTSSNAGGYTISVSGASAANYNVNHVNATLTITKVALTFAANNVSRYFGDNDPAFSIYGMGFVNGEGMANLSSQPAASAGTNASTWVGTYPITPFGGSSPNYDLYYSSTGVLTINKAPLSVYCNPASRNYGSSDPAFSIYYVGFKLGDGSWVIDYPPSVWTDASPSSNAGVYTIYSGGGLDNNYELVAYYYANYQIYPIGQSITFNAISPLCNTLGSVTLSASSTSGLPVSFVSSNPSIAGVSGNTLTFYSTGSVTVTASQGGNVNYIAASSVNQTAGAGSTTGSISSAGNLCTMGYVTLTAGNGTNYVWSTGATTQVTDVYDPGTYYVTYTINGCTATASKVVTRTGSHCIRTSSDPAPTPNSLEDLVNQGLNPIRFNADAPPIDIDDEFLNIKEWIAYPVPASKELNIVLPARATVDVTVTLYDQTGKRVINGVIGAGKRSAVMNVIDVPASIYILRIDGDLTTYRKVMIVHRE